MSNLPTTPYAEPRIARLTDDFLRRTALGKSDSRHRHSTTWSGAAMHMARSTPLHILHPPDMPESKIRHFTFGSRIPKADKRLHALMKAEHHPTLELALQVARDGTNQGPWTYRNEASDSTSSLGWWHSPSLECIPMDVRVYWVSMSWDTICVTCPRVFRTCLLTLSYTAYGLHRYDYFVGTWFQLL